MNIVDVQLAKPDELLALDPAGQPAFRIPLARPLAATEAALKLGIRPHRILVGDPQGLPATVVSNQWLGDQAHLALDLHGCFLVVVAHRPHRRRGRRHGAGAACRRRPCICSRPTAARRCSTAWPHGRRPPHEAGPDHRRRCRHLGHQGRGLRPRRQRAGGDRPRQRLCRPAGRRRRAGHGPHLGRHGGRAARPGAARAGSRPADGGAGDHRAGRRHLADRPRGRAGGARLAVARLARGRHRPRAGPQRRARPRLSVHRLRHERLHAVGAPDLAQAARARAARPSRHRVPLQGLALLQAHRRAPHRYLRGHLHLRQFPYPGLCAGAAGGVRSRRRGAPAAARWWRAAGRPIRSRLPRPPPPGCPKACRWCWAISTCSAPASAAGSTSPAGRSAARSWARPACTCASWPTRQACSSAPSPPATPCRSRCRAASPRCSPTWRPP